MKRFVLILLLAAMLSSILMPLNRVGAQGTVENQARKILQGMTPEERVGQLFLVTFKGTATDTESQIYDLIVNNYVGGVVLRAENDNFVAAPDTTAAAYQLTADLQTMEWNDSLDLEDAGAHTYVPLFVSIDQEGDGLPLDQILSGVTPLPPPMAIGASWKTEYAEQVGATLGYELSSLGFNLLFGPSLDVVANPRAVVQGDPGAYTFGGDPFWVGRMGQYYIQGLHNGSAQRLAVIAEHFPGRGEADRPAEEEVATVRKSLDQLKQVDLAPFFAVTGGAPVPAMQADGLLASHIRYQGFQGNIRATTRPISFDQQALGQILSLDELSGWRASGGIIVSENLGTRAVSRFYDPTGNSFLAQIVARDAFLSGNDLLNMGNIISSGDESTYQSTLTTISFFTQKYREDPAFAERVDDAVLRILMLKLRLYGSFDYAKVVLPFIGAENIGLSSEKTGIIARQSATLISPNFNDLANVLPDAPVLRDRLVFITDNRSGRQCSTCSDQPYIATDALQSTVQRLYGPQGGGQVLTSRLSAYSFDDLASLFSTDGNPDMEKTLSTATWVVFSALDLAPAQAHTQLLTRFLSERADLLRDKKVVLFLFGAPYYLDATDVTKLSAYYVLYGKSQPFVDTAARLLFREVAPTGDSPVSIPGTGYDLIEATSPYALQVIQLNLDLAPAPTPQAESTPEPTAVPLFSVGDAIYVRTGAIADNNGNPVPDGTVVTFTMKVEGGVMNQVQSETLNGVALASFRLEEAGLVEITATSEPATTSVTLQIDVTPGEPMAVTVIAPTQEVTATSTAIPTATPEPEPESSPLIKEGFPLLPAWILAMMLVIFGAGMTYILIGQVQSTLWALRWAVCVLLGGLAAYNYAALGLPGSNEWVTTNGFSAILLMVVMGMIAGFISALVWKRLPGKKK